MRSPWEFRVRQGVLSVVAGACVAVVTNMVTDQVTVPLVVGLVALVTMQVGLTWWRGWTDLAAARQHRDAVLIPLHGQPPPVGMSPLVWLSAPFSPTPLWGRNNQLAALRQWCFGGSGSVQIVSGPAGAGKSRLVLELAKSLPAPWVVGGWRAGIDVVDRVVACPEPVLLVVDDADRIMPGVADLLIAAARHRDQIRVLLVCRHGEGLRQFLQKELPESLRPVVGCALLELAPVGADSDRRRWFDQATRAYSRELRVPPPALPPLPVGDDQDTMLLLHARGLLAALDRAGSNALTLREVAQELLGLEAARWRTPAGDSEETLTEVILALTVLPAFTTQDAVRWLRRLHRFQDTDTQTVTTLAEWARMMYPPEPTGTLGLRPHLIAEWLLVSRLGQHLQLLDSLHEEVEKVVLASIQHASHTFPEALTLLGHAIGNNTKRLATAVALVAELAPNRALDQALAGLIDTTSIDHSQALQHLSVPEAWPQLTWALTALAVARFRNQVAADPDRYRAGLADCLTSLGTSLRDVGRPQTALAADEEAVQLWRDLAGISPNRYRPDLARALTGLGSSLRGLGRCQESLDTFREVVQIERGLAGADPGRYCPDLARSLMNFGLSLRGVGRPQAALAADEEAIQLWRDLAITGSGRYCPDLAHCLMNFGASLRGVGRPQMALVADEEAVRLWRDLADLNPDRYRPYLAHSLVCLGESLMDLGQPGKAVGVSREAVQIRRDLTDINPGYYCHDLAHALNALGLALVDSGWLWGAGNAFREALRIGRAQANANPARYRICLAHFLGNLSAVFHYLGEYRKALGACREVVQILRDLASASPGRYGRDFALSLNNMGVLLWSLGQRRRALIVLEEAVQVGHGHAKTDFTRHCPILVTALTNLAGLLAELGRSKKGLAATREAASILREYAQHNPVVYETPYRRLDAEFRRLLDERGDREGAVTTNLALRA